MAELCVQTATHDSTTRYSTKLNALSKASPPPVAYPSLCLLQPPPYARDVVSERRVQQPHQLRALVLLDQPVRARSAGHAAPAAPRSRRLHLMTAPLPQLQRRRKRERERGRRERTGCCTYIPLPRYVRSGRPGWGGVDLVKTNKKPRVGSYKVR